jgi:hypothetical protein
MSEPILGSDLLIKLCAAVGVDPNRTQRVIIDAAYNDVTLVYVQMVGTIELLNIDFTSAPIKVKILKKADGE